jgi:hypothetical protein
MTNFNHSFIAAIGAVLVSTLFVAAAVGPAQAIEAAPAATASVQTSAQAHA